MTETAHTIGMSWADRVWVEMSSSVILGPLELPDLDALRAAFVRLAGLGAQTRMGYSISDDRAHWRYDPASLLALAAEAVIEIPAPQIAADTPEADVLAVANRLMEQAQQLRGPAAVRVVRAGNFVIYDQNHAIGDARPLLDNLSALIRVAAGGSIPEWALQEVADKPLWLALTKTFGPGRQRLAPLLRGRLARSEATPGAPLVDCPLREPDLGAYVTVMSLDSWRQIKRWRRDRNVDASMASIFLVLARRALAAVGVPLTGETTVLYDCRRHLPSGSQVRGNFVVGFIQRLPDDPVLAGQQIAQTAGSGRALLTLASATWKHQTVRGLDAGPVNPVCAQSAMAYVFGPRHSGLERLPWLRPELRCAAARSTTSDLAGLTLTVMLLGGRLSVSWSFHRNVIDERLLRAATDLMETDPISLLEQSAEVIGEEAELGGRR